MKNDNLQIIEVEIEEQEQQTARVRGYSNINSYHWQPQGFASKAPRGSRALMMRLGRNPANAATLLAHQDADAPISLRDREVTLFSGENYLHIKPTTDGFTINGNVQINGNLNVRGDISTDRIDSVNEHVHSGVRSGPSNTGGPQ